MKWNCFLFMIKNKLKYICLINLFLFACTEQKNDGFSKSDKGFYYRLFTIGDENKKIKQGDLVEFKAFWYQGNSRLETDSFFLNENSIDTISIPAQREAGKFESAFLLLAEGDSAAIKMKAGDFNGRYFKKARGADDLICYLKVKTVYRNGLNYRKELEEQAIARYISHDNSKWEAHPSGLFIKKTLTKNTSKCAPGETCRFNYAGYFLNGVRFDDYSSRNPYFEWVIGTQNQLIRGLEIAIQLMGPGEQAEVIIPAALAFGNEGSSTRIVPPGKTLLYRLQVLDSQEIKQINLSVR